MKAPYLINVFAWLGFLVTLLTTLVLHEDTKVKDRVIKKLKHEAELNSPLIKRGKLLDSLLDNYLIVNKKNRKLVRLIDQQ